MPRFKKKPIVIDTFQWTGIDCEIPDWFVGKAECHSTEKITNSEYLIIKTLEGDMKVGIGDYIIKGIAGELYPIKEEILEATYELVEQ